jgi:hypothetical protein
MLAFNWKSAPMRAGQSSLFVGVIGKRDFNLFLLVVICNSKYAKDGVHYYTYQFINVKILWFKTIHDGDLEYY